jgi:hypothetical protein
MDQWLEIAQALVVATLPVSAPVLIRSIASSISLKQLPLEVMLSGVSCCLLLIPQRRRRNSVMCSDHSSLWTRATSVNVLSATRPLDIRQTSIMDRSEQRHEQFWLRRTNFGLAWSRAPTPGFAFECRILIS